MGPIKATNWALRILLSWTSVSDIVQLQDLHQTAFISSLNWEVGQAIKSRKASLSKRCCDSLIFDTPICEQSLADICSSQTAPTKEMLYNALPLQRVNPSLKWFNWAQ